MKNEAYLSDKTLIALTNALAEEVIKNGEAEAHIIASDVLTDSENLTIMKANTLLTAFGMLLIQVVENNDVALARKVITIWTSSHLQGLVQYAFTDEIKSANDHLAQEIDDLEKFINGEGNK